jgi:hypothetical protein
VAKFGVETLEKDEIEDGRGVMSVSLPKMVVIGITLA